jgi:hypothetical protein
VAVVLIVASGVLSGVLGAIDHLFSARRWLEIPTVLLSMAAWIVLTIAATAVAHGGHIALLFNLIVLGAVLTIWLGLTAMRAGRHSEGR